jgi:hypothetical protein
MTLRNTLKSWFSRGKYPTQNQFAEWIDSFFHLQEDELPITKITGLQEALDSKQPIGIDPDDIIPIILQNEGSGNIILGDISVYNSFKLEYVLKRGQLTEFGEIKMDNKNDEIISQQSDFDDAGFTFSKSISGSDVRLSWIDYLENGNNGQLYITKLTRTKIQ